MKIVDYIYYRLYKMYKKHNEPARFSSSLMFGILGMISFFYISILFNKFLSNHYFSLKNFSQIHGVIWVLLIGIIISIGIFFRYTPNRTLELLKKFSSSIWNKIIHKWIILIMPLIVFLLGLILCKIFL